MLSANALRQMLLGAVCLISGWNFAAAESPRWTPVTDTVYLQEVGRQIASDSAVRSIALFEGSVYVGTESGFGTLAGDAIAYENRFAEQRVSRMVVIENALWVLTDKEVHRLSGGTWERVSTLPVADVCQHAGVIYAAGSEGLLAYRDGAFAPANEGRGRGGIQRIASHAETLYCLAPGNLLLFDGNRFINDNVIDWGELPSRKTRDMYNRGDALIVATDRGLAEFRGMSMIAIGGEQGLCYEDTTCVRAGFSGDYWVGTTRGAIRAVNGDYQYFNGARWLPGENVFDIAAGENVVYIATDKGIGIIEYVPYTLAKKAAYYERHLEEWGQKRTGFTFKLELHPELGGWVREVSDNDGGWSADYLAAMCFKYAVTKDEATYAEATNTFDSLRWLEQITGIPGFPARSIFSPHETVSKAMHGSGGLPAEWHETADGNWQWKGDTSSDETDLHFFAGSLFHDLVANDQQKQQAKNFLSAMSNHIIDNGWVLRDYDGLPTRWARWDPGYLQRPYGWYARGLNGLEILVYMQTAYALTGNPKFLDGYKTLQSYGYPQDIIRQKLVFPPDYVNNSDDRMAFVMYNTIMRYETDPAMRSIYARSLARSWEIERIEAIPFFNFIYGGATGNACDTDRATQHLRDWPLDLVNHSFQNSHRDDLYTPKGMIAYAGGSKPLSPRERGPQRWTDSTLGLDGGGGGREVVDPSSWLEAYWMGRHYGMISAPETSDPALTTVEKRGLQLGAKPYDGPARPPLRD